MKVIVFLFSLIIAWPAFAQNRMTAQEFDEYSRGKTLFFSQNGDLYGAEIYRENRRVEWSFLDGQCKKGVWYEEDGLICFVYEDTPEPQCWSFTRGSNGLIARFEDRTDTTELYEAQDIGEEMICLGPKVGV